MRIANKWSEVSLKQYIEIADINAIDMDVLDKQVKILSILSKTPEDIICQMNLSDLKEAIRHCQFIYTPPLAGHIKQYIRIGKRKFNVNTNVKDITGGEYIDLTSLIKDQADLTRNLPRIISIFLHPVNMFGFKKKSCYKDKIQTLESRNATTKLIESNLMMDNVMMLSGFFLKSYNVLMQATLDYSVLEMKKTRAQLNKLIKEDSKSIGVGI